MERVIVVEASQVAEARRRASATALALGFDDEMVGTVALAATELATNLIKHGGGGEILIDRRERLGQIEVELVALDRGAGMPDVETCLRDGYSTAGSAGTGLGALRRLASGFEVYSRIGAGSVVLVRIAAPTAGTPPLAPDAIAVGGIAIPLAGEVVCGDAWCVERDGRGAMLMVADGLGHGPAAAEASRAAVTAFQAGKPRDVEQSMTLIHAALRVTRGAAVGIAAFDADAMQVVFCGVGNIAGTIIAPTEVKRMVSQNGTAGVSARRIQRFTYAISGASLVILASDGLTTSWSLDRYPGLPAADPLIIAAVLYRDHSRGRDDVTVVVMKVAA